MSITRSTRTSSSSGRVQLAAGEHLFRRLGEIARNVHETRFHEIMLKGLSEFVDWRARSVTRYSRYGLPAILFQEGKDNMDFELYLDGYYRLDPYYRLCQSGPAGGVYTLRRDFPGDMDNAYARAYMPLSGWCDDVVIFFPAMSSTSIGLFWEKSTPVSSDELCQLETIYPLLKGLHDAHLYTALGIVAAHHDWQETRKAAFAIAERNARTVYQTLAWDELARECSGAFGALIAEGGGAHRFSDGSALHVEMLPESFVFAPGGWIGTLEPRGAAKAPLTMVHALSDFSGGSLTPRETQILSLVLSGHSNQGIARRLDISVGAVKNHRTRLYKKLKVTTERNLVQLFAQHLGHSDNDTH